MESREDVRATTCEKIDKKGSVFSKSEQERNGEEEQKKANFD